MTWKFIYTYRERCKTGPAHNRCWNWSPFASKHTWMHFFKFWNTFSKVSTLTAWISWHIASLSCSIVLGVYFYTLCPSIGPKERSRQAIDWLPLVSKCHLTCFKWTCLPVFTNEKPTLFDCIHRQYCEASSERLTLYHFNTPPKIHAWKCIKEHVIWIFLCISFKQLWFMYYMGEIWEFQH